MQRQALLLPITMFFIACSGSFRAGNQAACSPPAAGKDEAARKDPAGRKKSAGRRGGAGGAVAASALPLAVPYGRPLPARFLWPKAAPTASLQASVARRPGPTGSMSRKGPGKGTLFLGRIDTGRSWSGRPPVVRELAKGLYLLYDQYDTYHAYLWEAARRRLTDLGRVSLLAVKILGRAVLLCHDEKVGAFRLCDVDPRKRSLRVLWSHDLSAGLQIIGRQSNALVLASYELVSRTRRHRQADLFFLAPGRRPMRQRVELGAHRIAGAPDAIRDGRLLLVGPRTPLSASPPGRAHPPFSASVSLLDLQTARQRVIGRARGGYTRCTGGIHPHLLVRWKDGRTPFRPDGCFPGTSYVSSKTERLLTLPMVPVRSSASTP